MKPVDNELLKKYHRGLCTDEEKQAVEQWLASGEFEGSLDLPDSEKTARKQQIWQTIARNAGWTEPQVVPMYQRFYRYAAAACVIIGAFFIGYFAALPSAQADTVEKARQLTDLLHIYGGDGAYGTVAGSRFRVKFEGSLRLYNEAQQTKQIVCGEQKFTLEPYETYCLIGSDEKAALLGENQIYDIDHEEDELTRDFLVQRLDD
ncbi:MAG: hypothetical protein ACFB15_07710 [Cyclobacteriaceae bacterium]